MQTPKGLKKGDKVIILSTARKIQKEELDTAIGIIKSWGLEPLLGETIGAESNQYAGSDAIRTDDFQKALNDPNIKAIFCARGGYGTIRMLDALDFSIFQSSPKWIIGYSDVTVLHAHIHQNFGVESLHANMPITYPSSGDNESTKSIWKALSSSHLNYTWDSHSLNKTGSAEAMLIGGNLSVLYSILGSNSEIDTRGKILFLEDLDEYVYHIDRMMINLRRSGKLEKLKGLIIGGMSDMNDNAIPFGKSAEEIILEHCKDYNYPVAFNFPAGHIDDNRALIIGRCSKLNVENNSCSLDQ